MSRDPEAFKAQEITIPFEYYAELRMRGFPMTSEISPILRSVIADAVAYAIGSPSKTFCVVTFEGRPNTYVVANTRDLETTGVAFKAHSPGYRAIVTDEGAVSITNSDIAQ